MAGRTPVNTTKTKINGFAVFRTTFQHNRRRAQLPPLGAVCRRPSTATASDLVAAHSGYALLGDVVILYSI